MYTKIKEKVNELKDEFVNIWCDVVKIDSQTIDKQGVDEVGQYFINYAKNNGWEYEVLENEKAGNAICITMNKGAKLQPIAISGHMDTVHPRGSMKTFIEGDDLYGPGAVDCKGGLIVCLLAMQTLKQLDYQDREIRLILQADEEVGSKLSNHKTIDFMVEKAKGCVCFLNTEMYEPNTAVILRKGISRYEIDIEGVAAHSSVCLKGHSAVKEAAHKIIKLEELQEEDGITISVGIINGGTAANVVPANCKLTVDVRFNNSQEMQKADEYIREVCAKADVQETSCTVNKLSTRIPLEYRKENEELLDKMNVIFKKAGMSELKARKATGGADSAYTSAAGIPTIDSIGVAGHFIHSKDEKAYIPSLAENAIRMASVIYGLDNE